MVKTAVFKFVDGIYVAEDVPKKFEHFEEQYLKVRTQEQRLLSIPQIRQLPETPEDYIHHAEWEIRKKNIKRYLKYLSEKKKGQEILDIGCGNGFFSNMMATNGHKVSAVDVNLTELRQAREAFSTTNIEWYYADIMVTPFGSRTFDQITFCCSFQYFNKPIELLNLCLSILNPGGEIHIIDSPFYQENEKEGASKRSLAHFQSLNAIGLANNYHHNTFQILATYNYRFGYTPGSLMKKMLKVKDSPFPWIVIRP